MCVLGKRFHVMAFLTRIKNVILCNDQLGCIWPVSYTHLTLPTRRTV